MTATTTRTRRSGATRRARPEPPPAAARRTASPPARTTRPAVPPQRAVPREAARTAPGSQPGRVRARPVPRMPFIFLIVGLLGGGLVCLLVLNTILASGSFQLTSLQQANTTLAQREQMLQEQIARDESPAAIAAEARKLGMVPVRQPHFVNLRTGRIYAPPGGQGAGR